MDPNRTPHYWATPLVPPTPVVPATPFGQMYPPMAPTTFYYHPPPVTTPPLMTRPISVHVGQRPADKHQKENIPPPSLPVTKKPRASPRTWEQKLAGALASITDEHGFDSFGHFLQQLFDTRAHYKHPVVSQTVASFLGGRNIDNRAPMAIVHAWYKHPKSSEQTPYDPQAILPPFSIPYDLPHLTPQSSEAETSVRLGTRDALSHWAVKTTLDKIDEEAELLAQEPSFHTPSPWSWEALSSFSIQSVKEKIISLAPVTWSALTTISVSPKRRSNINQARNASPDASSGTEPKKGWDAYFKDLSHDPWSGSAVLQLFLIFLRNPRASFLPTVIGLSLFMSRTNRLVYQALGSIGCTVAYSTVVDNLHSLSAVADTALKDLGRRAAQKAQFFVIVFDNINKHHRAWHQTVANVDEVRSGTAATLVEMVDVPAGAMNSQPYLERAALNGRKDLTVDMLVDDIDQKHIAAVGAATLLRIWTTHIPSLHKYRTSVNKIFRNGFDKHRIRRHQSTTYPLRTSGIDESTTEGNSDVLRDITQSQLGMADKDFEDLLILIAGDQLTVDRVRKLIHYTKRDVTTYARHSWALPFIQFWHMKWAFLKALFKAHFPDKTGKHLQGLRRDCEAIRREKLNPTKCDFYPHDAAITDTFQALCLEMLRVLLLDHPNPLPSSQRLHLVPGLSAVFASGGHLSKTNFDFLHGLAIKGYRRYMCTAAYCDSLGHVCRDRTIYAEDGPSIPRPSKATLDNEEPNWAGDRVHANLILRLRDCLWYYEMNHAISYGGSGRVFEVVKLLRFFFWGSGSTNYGNELLELACNFMFEYPPALITAIMNNCLVNPSGKVGHFHELDLMQEHYNRSIKTMYNSRNLDFDSPFIQEVSLNIDGFTRVREWLSSFFGFTPSSGSHTDASLIDDFNTLGAHYEKNDIFRFCPGRRQQWKTPDFFEEGFTKLDNGQLQVFLDRTAKDQNNVQVLPEADEPSAVESLD
ncbi:hypothetical protein ONZ45_g8295 [Pleurotus djamor]|nr:hypothetical protein ONZ45_g8295 [Pleurotus djamor]